MGSWICLGERFIFVKIISAEFRRNPQKVRRDSCEFIMLFNNFKSHQD